MIDYDGWRRRYDRMNIVDHYAFWDDVEREFPEQVHTHKTWVLDVIRRHGDVRRVVEIGGWKGELAACVLDKCPDIESWTNYDWMPRARDLSACNDFRYHVRTCQLLYAELPPECDFIVAGHVLEHMRAWEVEGVLRRFCSEAKGLYVEMPLPVGGGPQCWTGVTAAHILEIGWWGFVDLAEKCSFALKNYGTIGDTTFGYFVRSPYFLCPAHQHALSSGVDSPCRCEDDGAQE